MSPRSRRLEIRLLSYWHAGSGMGRSAEADALVLKDPEGLPYLPGRTVKGLLRDALRDCEEAGLVPPGRTDLLFGKAAKDVAGSVPGLLRFTDARLPEAEAAWLGSAGGEEARRGLYDLFASTKLDERGMAEDETLRTQELCVPVTLQGCIVGPGEDGAAGDWPEELAKACVLVRRLGSHRNRGLGRCAWTLAEEGADRG